MELKTLSKYGINVSFGSDKSFKPLQQSDFQQLKKNKYLVSFNLECTPVLFSFSKDGEKNICRVIQRGATPVTSVITTRIDDDVYNDTIIEGDMVICDGKKYVIFSDILVENGKQLEIGLQQRIVKLKSIVEQKHVQDPILDEFVWVVKDAVEYQHLKSFCTDYRSTLPYKNYIKGLVFRPTWKSNKYITVNLVRPHNQPITEPSDNVLEEYTTYQKVGKHSTMIDKASIHTFFIVPSTKRDKPDVYHVYNYGNGEISKLGLCAVTSLKNSIYLQDCFHQYKNKMDKTGLLKGLFFKCRWVERFKSWEPFEFSEMVKN